MNGEKEKIKFVTLCPWCDNVNLLKDVGMIPYNLYKYHGCHSTIACYKSEDGYSYLNKEVKGLKLEFIERKFNNMVLDAAWYLMKNAKKIQVLNIYHLSVEKRFIWAWIYKLINPKGIIYLKLDMDYRELNRLKKDNKIIYHIKKKCLQNIDIISGESKVICNEIQGLYKCKVDYFPNGCYEDYKIGVSEQEKQNIFLTVGRLGTEQKATELLLEAFAYSANEHSWVLRMVGPVQEGFQKYIDTFLQEHIELNNRIQYVGIITDKEKLAEEYAKAKVFVLPSRWESFGIVLVEALMEGCYIIVSDAVPSAKDITNEGQYGEIVKTNNVDALSEAMTRATQNECIVKKNNSVKKYAQENFRWETICTQLWIKIMRLYLERTQ